MYLGATDPRVKARQAIEKRIVLHLIDELLAQGFKLAVYDGEEEHAATTSRLKLIQDVMNTDEDYLIVYPANADQSSDRLGWVKLVYGNDGWDVISDYTVNLEANIAKTNALADKLAN